MNLKKDDILVVIPAFNEEESITSVVQAVRECEFRFIVVSDGSTDRTAEICRSIEAPVLELPINLGVGGALRTGFQYAIRSGYTAVVQIDADGQHAPDLVGQLIDSANHTGADLVLGSRFRSEKPTMRIGQLRRLVMRVLAGSASVASRTSITDATSGFRLIRTPLLEQLARELPTNYLGDTYECLIASGRAGYTIAEIPVHMSERLNGSSSASAFDAIKFTLKGLGVFALGLHPKIAPKSQPR